MELLWHNLLPIASEFRSAVIQRAKQDLEKIKIKPDPENRSFLFNCVHAVKIDTIPAQVQISPRVFIIFQTQRITADLWEQATCNSPYVVFTTNKLTTTKTKKTKLFFFPFYGRAHLDNLT